MNVTLFFAATGGGVQRGRVRLANELARRGHRVSCVMPELKGPFIAELDDAVCRWGLSSRNPIRVVRGFAEWLRDARPDIVFASQQHTIIAALAARAWARLDLPIVGIQHSVLSDLCANAKRIDLRYGLPILARLTYRHADRLCAVSSSAAADLARISGVPVEQIRVLPNPVIGVDLAHRAMRLPTHIWVLDRALPFILAAGNLVPVKDFATLIRAFAEALRQQPGARLIILGDGPERDALKALAADLHISHCVDLPGFEPNPYPFMRYAAAFVLSSRSEGLGNVLIEAMACGTPVIATDCGGPRDILEADGKRYGRLVPVGDIQAMAAAIVAILAGDSPGTAALQERAAAFSVARAASAYLDVANDVLGTAGHPQSEGPTHANPRQTEA